MNKHFLIVILILFGTVYGFAQRDTRGLDVVVDQVLGRDATIGKQWAVFIAIDRYREWNQLSNPVKDAKELRALLVEQYFIDEVIELYDYNATAENIRRLFADLQQRTAQNDSVFMFYAGHGYTDPLTRTGSWIPTDAGTNRFAQSNWIANIQIRNMLASLPARHVFLASDACFSGDILDTNRGAAPEFAGDYYRRAYSKVSRQIMTSGANETVPDASEFALRLKSALNRAEGLCVDPEYLFTTVREVRQTHPLLGIIRESEHQEGGSFLFFRRPTESQSNIINVSYSLDQWPVQNDSRRKALPISHDETTKTRMHFTTRSPNTTVRIFMAVSSEGDCDIAFVGKLDDGTASFLESNSLARISGITTKIVPVIVPSAGAHFIEVGYRKDGSVNSYDDSAWFFMDETATAPRSLIFSERVNDRTIKITRYIGEDTTLVLPDRIQDLPVTQIDYDAFAGSTTLINITVQAGVTSIGNRAFYHCTELTNVMLPSTLTSIGGSAFYQCTNLSALVLPSGISALGDYAFYYCTKLANITLPSGLGSIGAYTFYNCTSLKNIALPSRLTSIGERAFQDCTGITTIALPASVNAIGDCAFYNCASLASITVPSNSSTFASVDGVLLNKAVTTLIVCPPAKTSYAVPSTVTTIAQYGFSECSVLSSVTLPSGLTTIGDYAFQNCSGLKSIALPSRLSSIGASAFYNCSGITTITIPAPVGSLGNHTFSGCTNLTTVNFSVGLTSIGDYTFQSCSRLTVLNLPSSLTTIGLRAFQHSTNLTTIAFPAGLSSIADSLFYHCDSLTAVTVPTTSRYFASVEGVLFDKSMTTLLVYPAGKKTTSYTVPASVQRIKENAFAESKSLTSVVLQTGLISADRYAFYECTSLNSIILPVGLTTIGEEAFRNCTSLYSIIIPITVATIDSGAFYECTNLTIIALSRNTALGYNAFYNVPKQLIYYD